jgi:serine/threonine-protein kinase
MFAQSRSFSEKDLMKRRPAPLRAMSLPAAVPPPTAPYTLVATIAQGGMGYVELCFRREGRFLRWCARKRLHEQLRSDAAFRSMFMDEARLAGLVRHPNAVGVLDVGEDRDGPFLIMDFVEGVSLSRVIAQAAALERSFPMQVAVRICLDAAKGLHAAHEVRSADGTILHLVHRDVSPQNILIGFDGTVRVTDFGIAKALGNTSRTSAGVLKGNMGYLSPEQLRFEEPDRRSDFFSLGVTLYELLSGQRLYSNTDGFDGTRRILGEPPPDIGEVRNDVPPELVELLFELLAKARESRPATAAEIAGRLEGVLAVLIAEEGSVTVADYMDQHFEEGRLQQRQFLAQHLARLEAARPVTPPSLPVVSSVGGPTPPVDLSSGGRPRMKMLLGASVLAAAVWAILGTRSPTASPSSSPSSPSSPTASAAAPPAAAPPAAAPPAAARPAVPRPLTAEAAIAARGASPTDRAAIPAFSRRKAADASARREAARRVAARRARTLPADRGSSGEDHLTVPLFTRWQ